MTGERYWLALIKHWKLMCASVVLVGLGAFVGSKLSTPLYQASILLQVSVSVNHGQANADSLIVSNDLAQSESELAASQGTLQIVASHYKNISVEQLIKEVRSSVRANTQLFEIDVIDSSPERATTLASDIASTLIQKHIQMVQQNNRQALQPTQQEITSIESQISVIIAQIASLQGQSGAQAQITALQNQRNDLQQRENQEQTLLVQLELIQAQSGSFLNIVQSATSTRTPVQPDILSDTYSGLLTGLILGLALTLLIEHFDTNVRTVDAIHQQLQRDWPNLAIICQEDTTKMSDALVNPGRSSLNSEAYYTLRTNIGFFAVDTSLQTLVITSPTPQQGKSVIAANLAIALAKSGTRTVLIDANLHHPTQHEKFLLPIEKQGLSNALLACSQQSKNSQSLHQSQPAGISLEMYMHSVNIPNLLVIPSGPLPPNPLALLDSNNMEQLLKEIIKCGASMIVVDTPPLLDLPDADILAAKADGVILVVDVTSAHKGKLRQVGEQLTKRGVHVLGYVANRVKLKK